MPEAHDRVAQARRGAHTRAGVGAEHERDVVIGAKRVEVRTQEDVPSFAARPLEDAQKGEPLATVDREWRDARGIEATRVDAERQDVQLVCEDPARRERPLVERRRHPDLVHRVRRRRPARRHPGGLEHRAADVVRVLGIQAARDRIEVVVAFRRDHMHHEGTVATRCRRGAREEAFDGRRVDRRPILEEMAVAEAEIDRLWLAVGR